MKIAYFLDLPNGLGGAGSLLLKQAELMNELHSVEVAIPCSDDGIPNSEYVLRCARMGIKYSIIPYNTAFNFYSVDLFGSMSYVAGIYNYLRDNHIEFVHSTQLNVGLEYACRKLNIPHLMNVYQLRDDEFSLYYGDLYPRFHLCDSEKYSCKWGKYLPLKSKCLRPISFIDELKIKTLRDTRHYKILMLGRVCPRKNQLAAIKVIEKLQEDYDVEMTIAGELVEDYANECREYVNRKNLQGKVSFVDFVSDVIPLLDSHDIFLCTSFDESFPSSIVEAVSRDLSIVTTPAGGICEIFNSGNAFISEDFSTDNIYNATRKCITAYETGKIEAVHQNARKVWTDFFSKNAIQKVLRDYYEEICSLNSTRIVPNEFIVDALITYESMIKVNNGLSIYRSRILYIMKLLHDIECKKAYIWGAGVYGQYAYDLLSTFRKDIELVAYIDRNKRGFYNNIPIISPEHMNSSEVDTVFVAYKGNTDETVKRLTDIGYIMNKTIWKIN